MYFRKIKYCLTALKVTKMELSSYNQFPCKNYSFHDEFQIKVLICLNIHSNFRLLGATNICHLNALPSWSCFLLFYVSEAEEHALRFNANYGNMLEEFYCHVHFTIPEVGLFLVHESTATCCYMMHLNIFALMKKSCCQIVTQNETPLSFL